MTITIGTANLVAVLTDSLQCAGQFGIHFATHRADYGDEPGMVDVLAATAAAGSVVGHTWVPVDGQMIPCVWPVNDTETVLAIAKNLLKARGKSHTVDLEVVEILEPGDDGEHAGHLVTLCETPALFDSDTEFQFHADAEGKFPLATSQRTLSGVVGDKEISSTELWWTAGALAAVTAVAKRRKLPLQFFRDDKRRAHLVQIGSNWLGAAVPLAIPPGAGMSKPSIEPLIVVPNSAATELAEHLAKMKADGITVTVQSPVGRPLGPVTQTLADALNEGQGSYAVAEPVDLSTASGLLTTPIEPDTDEDEMLRQAVELVVTSQFGSCSMLQRKLRIGYGRAMRYIDRMVTAGIIEGVTDKPTAARKVLVTDLSAAYLAVAAL